jgi:integrase/recombinase XerD
MADFVSKALAKSIAGIGLLLPKQRRTSRMSWSLYDARGRRKYLVPKERWAFLDAAIEVGGDVGTFCAVLAFTGARISEVLALTPERIDDSNGALNFETLKRRERGIIRAVPVPRKLFAYLATVHRYREAQLAPALANQRLWSWSRTTAWRRVKEVMRSAQEPEFVSMPKALRHALLVKKWMGHAKLETTEIYTALIGDEERSLARLTWKRAARGFQQ